jgi:hypothetical protein
VASGDLWVPGQAAARKRCTDELLSQQNCVHCAQQLKGGIQLRDVARCTSAQGFACHFRIVVSVKNINLESGETKRICRAASIPFSFGRAMSSTTKSGLSSSAF